MQNFLTAGWLGGWAGGRTRVLFFFSPLSLPLRLFFLPFLVLVFIGKRKEMSKRRGKARIHRWISHGVPVKRAHCFQCSWVRFAIPTLALERKAGGRWSVGLWIRHYRRSDAGSSPTRDRHQTHGVHLRSSHLAKDRRARHRSLKEVDIDVSQTAQVTHATESSDSFNKVLQECYTPLIRGWFPIS